MGGRCDMAHKIHKSITLARVEEAAKAQMFGLENPGFCLACGADADGCEPDACGYHCEECERDCVYGAQEVLMMLA